LPCKYYSGEKTPLQGIKETGKKKKRRFKSAQKSLGLQCAGEEAEDRFAVQEVSGI